MASTDVAKSYLIESGVLEALSVLLTIGFLIQALGERYLKNLTALSWFFHRIGLAISIILLIICIDNLRVRGIMPTFVLSLLSQYAACMLLVAYIIAAIAHLKRSKFILQTYKPIIMQDSNLEGSLVSEAGGSSARKPVPKHTVPFFICFDLVCGTTFSLVAFFSVNKPWPFSITLFILLVELCGFSLICAKCHYELIQLVLMCRANNLRDSKGDMPGSKSGVDNAKVSLSVGQPPQMMTQNLKFAKMKFQEEFEVIQKGMRLGIVCVLVLGTSLLQAIYLLISRMDLPAESFENVSFYPQYLPSLWLWEFLAAAIFILYCSWDISIKVLIAKATDQQVRSSASLEQSGMDRPLVAN